MKNKWSLIVFLAGLLLFVGCKGQPSQTTQTPSSVPVSATPLPQPQALDLGVLGKGAARDLAWSPDNRLLAVTSSVGVFLYDAETWQVTDTIPGTNFGERPPALSLVFSRDGQSLILHAYSYPSTFWHYDLHTKQLKRWLENITLDPQTVPVFSPDGKTFAYINRICEQNQQSCAHQLELRENATGALLKTLQPNGKYKAREDVFVFSPNGSLIAVGSQDNHIRVWHAQTGELRYDLLHDSQVASLAFSPDGKILASASADATARFWEMQTGKSLSVLRGFKKALQYIAFMSDAKSLLIGRLHENIFQKYALDENQLPTVSLDVSMSIGENLGRPSSIDPKQSATIRLSPDTHKMAVQINSTVGIWDTQTGQLIVTLPEYNSEIQALEFSPHGDLLALVDHNVQLWHTSTKKFVGTLPIHAREIKQIAFQPQGQQLALVKENMQLEMWDTNTRQMLRREPKDNSDPAACYISRIAYAPNGASLATLGSCDLQILDAATGRPLQKFKIKHIDVNYFAFSADGNNLIYVDRDGLHSLSLSGQPIYNVRVPGERGYWEVAAAANLMVFAEGLDGPFRFFDLLTGRHLYDFGPGNGGTTVAIHPQGRLFARADYRHVLLADAASGQEILSIKFDLPYFIKFSPDGRTLAASSYQNIVQLWDVASADGFARSAPLVTATPDAAITPTLTVPPPPIPTLALDALPTPPISDSTINPKTIARLQKRDEFGLGRARTAAWAPDGKTIAIGINTGAYVFAWGAKKPTHFLPADQGLNLLVFSPNAHLLAGQSSNMYIQVWDLTSGRSLHKLEQTPCWNQGMRFSPDNASLSADCGDRVVRWSMSDGRLMDINDTQTIRYNTNSDGSLIVHTGMTQVWLTAANSGEIVQVFDVPEMAPALAQFSPDDKTLLVWFYKFSVGRTGVYYPGPDAESLVQLWEILPGKTPTLRTSFVPGDWSPATIVQLGAFQGLAFSPDSRRIVTASGDGQAQIWELASSKLLATLPHTQQVYFSPNSKHLIAVGDNVKIWDVSSTRPTPSLLWEIPDFTGQTLFTTFRTDNKAFIAASSNLFRIWRLDGLFPAAQPTTIPLPETTAQIASASPDGKWLAYANTAGLSLLKNEPGSQQWQTLQKFTSPPYILDPDTLLFSPDSSFLAAKGLDRNIWLWQLQQPEVTPIKLTNDLFIANLQFNPAGKLLLGSSSAPAETVSLYLWETATGKLLRTWQTKGAMPVFHPNGVTVATASYNDGIIRLYDLRTWKLLQEIKSSPYMRNILFNPDGSLLMVVYTEKIDFWQVDSGKLLKSLNGSFQNVAFSPDGAYLMVRLWDGRNELWGLAAP